MGKRNNQSPVPLPPAAFWLIETTLCKVQKCFIDIREAHSVYAYPIGFLSLKKT